MDYEKKYKEALEKAREWYNKTEPDSYTCIVESIFPELKESEDERIRKELIQLISCMHDADHRKKDWIAWLEKQGNKSTSQSEFKVGDLIKEKDCTTIYKILEIYKDGSLFVEDNLTIPYSELDKWELVEQKPADKVEPKFVDIPFSLAKKRFGVPYYEHPVSNNDVEYIRTDTFITKACEWLKEKFQFDEAGYCTTNIYSTESMIYNFKNTLGGEL